MEYQKIISLLENTTAQPSKFRTQNSVEVNDDSHRTCYTNSQMKFKNIMLKSNLCHYSDAYVLVEGTITVFGVVAAAQ